MNKVILRRFSAFLLFINTSCTYQSCYDISVMDLRFVSMDTVPTSDVIFVTSVTSLAACAVACINQDNCEAFFYHISHQNCSLHSQHVAQISSTPESGWIGYDFPDGVRPETVTSSTRPTTTVISSATTTGTTPSTTGTTISTTSTSTSTTGTTTSTTTSTSTTGQTTPITTSTTTTGTSTTTSSSTTGTATSTTISTAETTTSTATSTSTTGTTTTTTAPTTTLGTTTSTTTVPTTTTIAPSTTTTATSTTTTNAPTTTAIHSLWVDSVVDFSSQWEQDSWSAQQIIGENNVYPNHGDFGEAWASRWTTRIEWIQVQIAIPLYITQIDIYETYHAGGVTEVAVLDPATSTWDVLWQTTGITDLPNSRIFSPPIQTTAYKADQVRIETDCSLAQDWVELDAVKVTGYV